MPGGVACCGDSLRLGGAARDAPAALWPNHAECYGDPTLGADCLGRHLKAEGEGRGTCPEVPEVPGAWALGKQQQADSNRRPEKAHLWVSCPQPGRHCTHTPKHSKPPPPPGLVNFSLGSTGGTFVALAHLFGRLPPPRRLAAVPRLWPEACLTLGRKDGSVATAILAALLPDSAHGCPHWAWWPIGRHIHCPAHPALTQPDKSCNRCQCWQSWTDAAADFLATLLVDGPPPDELTATTLLADVTHTLQILRRLAVYNQGVSLTPPRGSALSCQPAAG